MKKRKLRDIEVSAIGMGCMDFTHAYGDGPEEAEGIRLVHKAFELGCNFFDTAEKYSYFKNEEFVGKALEDSLRRLQTDYIDIYTEHQMEDGTEEQVAYIMGELIKEGKIRAWGQSSSTAEQIRKANAVTPITAIQSEYSMMERKWEKDVLPLCRELGIGYVAFAPMGNGFLSGKYHSGDHFQKNDLRKMSVFYEMFKWGYQTLYASN